MNNIRIILDSASQPVIGVMEMLVILVFLMAVIVGLQGYEIFLELNRMKNQMAEAKGEVPVRKTTWFDLFRRKGISMDKFVEGHNYDGIQEYDNSPPAWFNWIFFVTIVFAVVYLLRYHVFKTGDLQVAEYEKQVKEAAPILARVQERAIYLADQPRLTDQASLALGKSVFKTNCVTCHGQNGEGIAGPNLTDDYWLHGGHYNEIFKTIFNGVEQKGMPVWKKSLKPDDIRAVASYVYTLRGTNPPNPKAPQGEKMVDSPQAGGTKQSGL